MRVLAAIIAGGRASRFGADKAAAQISGRALIDHVVAALRPQAEALIIVGREWPAHVCISDLPMPGLGPLGGLAGAMDYAAQHNFDTLLTGSCDVFGLPDTLRENLLPAPAIVDTNPLVGLWPVAVLPTLLDWIKNEPRRSMYGFAEHIGARAVTLANPLININRPADLEGL
jgi:molybdenum cofactor guanylyltransferase